MCVKKDILIKTYFIMERDRIYYVLLICIITLVLFSLSACASNQTTCAAYATIEN